MIKINKIEKEKFYLPTYPNFFEHATPNTNNNFFWPNRQCDRRRSCDLETSQLIYNTN